MNNIDNETTRNQTTLNRKPSLWIHDCIALSKPFWKSSEKYSAILLITFAVFANLAQIAVAIRVNKWYNHFYDAIQDYDKHRFYILVIHFCILAILTMSSAVLAYFFRKLLEIKWRKWLTSYYITNWFSYKAFYKMRFLEEISDNPDQRISEDISSFIHLTLNLTLGLLKAVVTLFSFVIILWNLSGNLSFTIGTHHFIIFGSVVWIALLYALAGTYLTFKIGKPLIKLDYQEEAYEARFRYGLVRVREYSEGIAFSNGEKKEHTNLMHRFKLVINNFIGIVYQQMKISIVTIWYTRMAIIFPFIITAPRYFAKLIQLGDVMQINSAFARVQNSLSYFINAYASLSIWRATMDRLLGFEAAITQTQDMEFVEVCAGDNILELKDVSLALPNGNVLAKNISFTLNNGDRLLIKGKSGCGKTILLRVIAGLWQFANGNIQQKPEIKSLFLSQKPYLPIDNLAFSIAYPKTQHLPYKDELAQILIKCKLAYLVKSLSIIDDWSTILSLGEQQRIAFCRILINKPDIVYLDDATSAQDEETENELYNLLITELPHTVIVSVSHRSNITKWHNQTLNFNTLVS